MAKDSDVETFCALRLFIDSWRWAGVPWYVRSGKCLTETASEVLVELKPPPERLFDDSSPADGRANYLRFRLAPNPEIALAARVKRAGEEFVGDQRELSLLNGQPSEEQPYERLLGDALVGDGALFTREDTVEAAWAVVDPVLEKHDSAHPYLTGSWGRSKRTRSSRPLGAGTTRCCDHSDTRHIGRCRAFARARPVSSAGRNSVRAFCFTSGSPLQLYASRREPIALP